jgi:hypothetical protein
MAVSRVTFGFLVGSSPGVTVVPRPWIGRLEASMLATNGGVLALIASIGRPVHESIPLAGVVIVTIDVGRPVPKAA